MKIIAASYLYNPGEPPVEGGGVAIRNGRIEAVDTLDRLKANFNAPVEEYPGYILFPGMVNAHTHLELTHFPAWKVRKGLDYAPGTYVDWVIQVIKLRRGLSRIEVEHSITEGARISIESGTTTIGEILTDLSFHSLYRELKLFGRVYLEAIGQDPRIYIERKALIEQTLEGFNDDSLFPGVSPHAPHTLSEQFMREIVSLAASRELPLMIHLAESTEEVDFIYDSRGKIAETLYPFAGWEAFIPAPSKVSPVIRLDSLGVLNSRTTVVHCVHVTPNDVSCLRERGVSVVLCPRSNERLAVGAAPLMLFKSAGIPLALGTDSLASNDSLSLWDELRFLYERFPRMFTPEDLLVMATKGGAKAIHLEAHAGSLKPGMLANIQVLKTPGSINTGKIAADLVQNSEVSAVYLAGEQFKGYR